MAIFLPHLTVVFEMQGAEVFVTISVTQCQSSARRIFVLREHRNQHLGGKELSSVALVVHHLQI